MTRARMRPALVLAAWLACGAPLTSSLAHAELAKPCATLTPLARRTTDEIIAADLACIAAWRARLATLPNAAKDPWRARGADAWLDVAREEYTDHDETGFTEAAFAVAISLIEAIELKAAPATREEVPEAKVLRGSARVREELWAELERLKRGEGFDCSVDDLVWLEVQLAWAGNEQVDLGDCETSPHLAAAERHARDAAAKDKACRKEPVVVAPPAPPKPPALALPTREELKLPRNVHFALNQFAISPESRRVITRIAEVLTKYPSVRVRLVGHTDSRGSVDYNLKLSQNRVNAVAAVLRDAGVDETRISTDYRGKSEQYAVEDSKKGFALNRRVEMVFVDPEGRDIEVERQEGDLQIESDASPRQEPPKRTP